MKKGVYICASVYIGESNITRKVRAVIKTRGKELRIYTYTQCGITENLRKRYFCKDNRGVYLIGTMQNMKIIMIECRRM
jgi:hypothetical protein